MKRGSWCRRLPAAPVVPLLWLALAVSAGPSGCAATATDLPAGAIPGPPVPSGAAVHLTERLLNTLALDAIRSDVAAGEVVVEIPVATLDLGDGVMARLGPVRWRVPVEGCALSMPTTGNRLEVAVTAASLRASLGVAVSAGGGEAVPCPTGVSLGRLGFEASLAPGQDPVGVPGLLPEGTPDFEVMEPRIGIPRECPALLPHGERLAALVRGAVLEGAGRQVRALGKAMASRAGLGAVTSFVQAPKGEGLPQREGTSAPGMGFLARVAPSAGFAATGGAARVRGGGLDLFLDVAVGARGPVACFHERAPPHRSQAVAAPLFPGRTPSGRSYLAGIALARGLASRILGAAFAAGLPCGTVTLPFPGEGEGAGDLPTWAAPLHSLRGRLTETRARLGGGDLVGVEVRTGAEPPEGDAEVVLFLQHATLNVEGRIEEALVRLLSVRADLDVAGRLTRAADGGIVVEPVRVEAQGVEVHGELLAGAVQTGRSEWAPALYREVFTRLARGPLAIPAPVVAGTPLAVDSIVAQGDHVFFLLQGRR